MLASISRQPITLEDTLSKALIGVVMWRDALSGLNTSYTSILHKDYRVLLSDSEIYTDLESLVACKTWVIVILLDIWSLRDLKRAASTSSKLSHWNLDRGAELIRLRLTEKMNVLSQIIAEQDSRTFDNFNSTTLTLKSPDRDVHIITKSAGLADISFLF
ncbi:hypothetical protein LTR84_008652 [Exophiala bonariae]|uniref:Uncharacterized protein n=1 Tax=Exophiala bonariae TaxID=1690606 RepID=A0AAV9MZ19_9EURO|nr:hypothetical protein LTR84_008652 [Exophiala bonariae]